jgi:transposase
MNAKIEELGAWLDRYPRDMKIVFETCGTYYWLADGLEDLGFTDLTMAHALELKKITMSKVKTDKHDAKNLAELHRLGGIPKAYIYPRGLRSYRDLARLRLNLVRKRAGEFKEMKMMLTRHGLPGPSRNDIHHLTEDHLEGCHGKEMHLDYVIGKTIHVNEEYSEWIKLIEDDLSSVFDENSQIQGLREIPGIGPILSKTILLEIGDINRFKKCSQFCSWSRVVPGIAQSGSSSKRGRCSKQGNAHMKNALMQAASAAVRLNPRVRAFKEYHTSIRRGSSGTMVTLNAVAHKIALGVWHVLQGRKFDLEKLFPLSFLENEEKILGCTSEA